MAHSSLLSAPATKIPGKMNSSPFSRNYRKARKMRAKA
nr:MAG TPA: hypothetical protein [Caudoviricetes sp.]DAZ43883.1 MAG TPA: hypothetical protein [Caudoviricetes sp.]